MKNIFLNAKIWEENDKNTTGLPRPFVSLTQNFIKSLPCKIAKKIPVPWQSLPYIKDSGVFKIIYENEEIVIKNNLCGYCGIKINDSEIVVRWKDTNFTVIENRVSEPRVASDIMPLHIECMTQARKFCPHMIKTKDEEFEYGDFLTLKQNGLKSIEDKKNTPIN